MGYIEVKLIEAPKNWSKDKKALITQINDYLLKNRGLIGDFNQLKELIDRKSNAREKDIKNNVTLPLYIGLVAALLSLVIAFLSLPSVTSIGAETLGTLFVVLKIALVVSILGFLLTVISWGFIYRKAAAKNTEQKMAMYDFIHQEMDQQLSHNITSSVYALQAKMDSFASRFEKSTVGFQMVVQEMKASFEQQAKYMRELKDTDLGALSEHNVKVIQEIRHSAKEFDKLNNYLKETNALVEGMKTLNANLEVREKQSTALERISKSVDSNIDLNKQMIEVLHSDLREIETRKKYMADAVINVDHALQKALEELSAHTIAKLNSIRELTIKEEHAIEKRVAVRDKQQGKQLEQVLSALQSLIEEMKENKAQ